MDFHNHTGWASISGSLLISDAENGGPGLSAEYIHVCFLFQPLIKFSNANLKLPPDTDR